MVKKKWLSLVLIFALIIPFSLQTNEVKAETEWQKVDTQIKQIQQKQKDSANKKHQIDSQINNVKNQQNSVEQEITQIDSQIDQTENKLFSLESQIEDTINEAKTAANDLELAQLRVNNRQELLKTRVRLMYEKGNVQYLEVLLGSTSFSDFVQRFAALQKIIYSDKKILLDNVNDKNTIEEKKVQIESALADLEGLYANVEDIKASLYDKKEERTVKIASLKQKEQELSEIKTEEEKQLQDLLSKEKELMKYQNTLKYNGGKFLWPVPSSKRITSGYGYRIDPINGKPSGHTGLDIGHAPGKSSLYGADIVAPADGIVILAHFVNGYGNTIMIDHGSNIWTLYGHIRNGGTLVKAGQRVTKGQKIAEVGSTGRSTGPHLHFEVRVNNKPVNPWNYLKDK